MKKIWKNIKTLLAVYTMGVFLAFLMGALKVFGVIKIINQKRLPRNTGNLIAVFNHPALPETILVPVLFWRDYIRHPIKLLPMSTPDRKNFDKLFWFWAKPSFIFIDRDNSRRAVEALHKMENVLNSGGILSIPPEGTRTFKAESYFHSRVHRKRLGILQSGVARLIQKTDCTILPIWIDGADRFLRNTLWVDKNHSKFSFPNFSEQIIVKIGNPVKFKETERADKAKIIQKVANMLLQLADEPS